MTLILVNLCQHTRCFSPNDYILKWETLTHTQIYIYISIQRDTLIYVINFLWPIFMDVLTELRLQSHYNDEDKKKIGVNEKPKPFNSETCLII